MSIHDNLNSPLLKRVKANEEALNELQDGAGSPTKIATGTDVYIGDSAALPIIDFKLTGKSVQNGTPTPDAPIAIHNSGDHVDIANGFYSTTTGAYSTGDTAICNKRPIPCSSGDIIAINTLAAYTIRLFFYNDTGFLSAITKGGTSASETVPSEATYFNFAISSSSKITPDTVGKITLTINGKYVVQIVENGKNLVKVDAQTSTVKGVTFTVNGDGSIATSGTSNGTYANFDVAKLDVKAGESYTFSGISGGSDSTYRIYFATNNSAFGGSGFSLTNGEITKTATVDDTVTFRLQIVPSGYSANTTFYPMIRKADTDGTYEPYKEKVATVLLEAPLSDTDVMSRTEVNRFFEEYVCTGNESAWGLYEESDKQPRRFALNDTTLFAYPNNDVVPLSNYFVGVPFNSKQDFGVFFQKNYIVFTDANSKWADLDSFKSWLVERYASGNPVVVYYPRATPTTETLDAASQAALNAIETFNPITHITVDSIIKPEISVEYVHEAYESIVNSLIDRIAADEWKHAGVAEGKTHLTLPEGWKELSIRIMSSPRNASLYIPRWMIESNATVKFYEISLMQKAERDVRLSIDKNEVYVWGVYNNGTELENDNAIITNMRTFVYYK